MSEPTSARAAKSREKLLIAATTLLVEAGPRGVTVDAVAECSGVAKSTLYRHWPSRDEMLVDVVRSNMPESPVVDFDAPFETMLRGYMERVAETLADPEWSRIIPALMSLRYTMPDLAAVAELDHHDKLAVLGEVLKAGVSEGVLPASVDSADAASILIGPLVFAVLSNDDNRLSHLAEFVVDRFLASYR